MEPRNVLHCDGVLYMLGQIKRIQNFDKSEASKEKERQQTWILKSQRTITLSNLIKVADKRSENTCIRYDKIKTRHDKIR